jgi:putative colanic acid biosynthesis acetyltransferase WcaF
MCFQALVFRVGTRWTGKEWRARLLRMWGAKIGQNTNIAPSVKILQPWRLEVGDWTSLAEGVEVYNFDWIRLGDQTVVSQRVFLCTGSHDYEDPTMPLTFKPIHIGHECWVAAEAFVGPGVDIGDRTVVGARAVVVKDLPPNMVCAGHPCRPLKPRRVKSEHEIKRDDSVYQQ